MSKDFTAVITGDIIGSRKLLNQEDWQRPLRQLLVSWGKEGESWEIFRGDSFQIESSPEEALLKAIRIKSKIKAIKSGKFNQRKSPIDVRLSIGIGEKGENSKKIGERTGKAYFYSGEAFEMLKKSPQNILIKSFLENFDRELNLPIRLGLLFMDEWSLSSAEIIELVLEKPGVNQQELGEILGIAQNSVSVRLKRANSEELKAILEYYKWKLNSLC